MPADFTPAPRNTKLDQQLIFPDQAQKSAAASAASSPGRRDETSPAPWNFADSFTHQNETFTLFRLYPGDETPEEITPHREATAELPTQAGHAIRQVQATARTSHLIHVVWTDDAGEIFGAWCPARSVIL